MPVASTDTIDTAIYLSLDRSGSMDSCKQLVEDAIGDFVEKLKADPTTVNAQFLLTQWDSQGFDIIRRGNISEVEPLKPGEFSPRALTPLYDATGFATEQLALANAKRNMLIIVTDGQENASRRWKLPALKEHLQALQANGWLIIYLAAHVDAWSQAEAVGIPKERAMNFRAASGSVPRTGWTSRFRRNKTTNPLSLALLACSGMAAAYCLSQSSNTTADVTSIAGFTDAQRNDAMGVDGITTTWQQAVAEDVASWSEPFNSIMDLPADVAEVQAMLSADFDPSLGSVDNNGVQIGQPKGEVLSDADYDAIFDGDDDERTDTLMSSSRISDDFKPSQSNRSFWDDDTSSRSYTPTHTSSDDSSRKSYSDYSSGSSGSDSSSSSSSDSSSSSSSSD